MLFIFLSSIKPALCNFLNLIKKPYEPIHYRGALFVQTYFVISSFVLGQGEIQPLKRWGGGRKILTLARCALRPRFGLCFSEPMLRPRKPTKEPKLLPSPASTSSSITGSLRQDYLTRRRLRLPEKL
jgi:hypothetical protein